jgi:hypothetical protein
VIAGQEPAAAKRRSPTRTAIGVLVSLVLVVAIFYFLLAWLACTAWNEVAKNASLRL